MCDMGGNRESTCRVLLFLSLYVTCQYKTSWGQPITLVYIFLRQACCRCDNRDHARIPYVNTISSSPGRHRDIAKHMAGEEGLRRQVEELKKSLWAAEEKNKQVRRGMEDVRERRGGVREMSAGGPASRAMDSAMHVGLEGQQGMGDEKRYDYFFRAGCLVAPRCLDGRSE